MTTPPPHPQVDIAHGSDASSVRIVGVIDERFQVSAFQALRDRSAPVLIDLDGVTRITSFGVREWMRALKDVATDQCFFARVRPAIVAQFNSVNQFGGRGHIVSIHCPYQCPSCDNAFEVLVDLRKQPDILRAASAPQMECPRCKALADFDDIESTYFGYVASAPPLKVPFAIEALLDGTSAKKPPLHVHKAVEGDLTVLWLKGSIDKGARLRRHADGLEGKVLVVFDTIDASGPDGFSALAELANAHTADVFLARVPMKLIKELAARTGSRKPSIISWIVDSGCTACGATDHVELRRHDAVPGERRRCASCGELAQIVAWTGDDVAAMSAMQLPVVPATIEAFMREHADWQTHTSVVGRDVPRREGPAKSVEAGTRIDKYEVVRRIGFGGMADVLLGRQLGVEGFEKKVVIKRILPHLAQQPTFVRMFLEEARVAARLLHGNIVQVYDLIHEGDEYYAILEFVRGADLNVLLKVSAQLALQVPVEIACRIVSDVCAGLNAAHTYVDDAGVHKPIVHRDVSPHNVLLSTEGAVKLTDFGIAKAADSIADDTGTGILKGKIMYMPPEAILGKGADHRADIYAAAVVLYQALTGANPFNRGGQAPTMRAVLDETAPDIRNNRPDVPVSLAAIIARGMHRDPAVRYQAAAALGGDLDDFLVAYGKPSSGRVVGAWVKELIGRGRQLNVSMPQNTPSSGQALDDATSVTAPVRANSSVPAGASDDWFELEELKSR